MFVVKTHVYTKPLTASSRLPPSNARSVSEIWIRKLTKEAGLSFITWN